MGLSGRIFAVRSRALRLELPGGRHLLPQPHPGWRQAAAAKHARDLDEVAHHLGIDPNRYARDLDLWLSHACFGKQIRIRMKPQQFEDFVRDGRYKTQFEVSNSGGLFNRGVRTLLEHTVLGIPPDARPEDRPVYGYLEGSNEAGLVQQYGPFVLVLRGSVRHRATVTVGDSLDLVSAPFLNDPSFIPSPLDAPAITAVPLRTGTPHGSAPLDPLGWSLGQASVHGYAEVQIYGGLALSDVEQVVGTLGHQPSPQGVAKLNATGINWTTQ
jgi:hypothetical protein